MNTRSTSIAAIGDEARALRLDHAREGPGADHRELLSDHVPADVDGHAAALADEADRAPGAGRADRGGARRLGAGAVEGQIDALAVGQLLERGDGIVGRRVEHGLGSHLLGQGPALGRGVERDDASAHGRAQLGGAQADRPLAEHGERVATRDVHAAQRLIRGAGAAGDRSPGREGQLIRQRHQRARRHFDVVGMGAMRGDAVDGEARAAQLRPAEPAMAADAAAAVVVVHDPHAGARLGLGYAGPDLGDDPARLVAGDDRLRQVAQAERPLRLARRGAIELQVAAAHARGLDLQHDLAGTRGRVGEAADLQLAIAGEHHAAHAALPASLFAPTLGSLTEGDLEGRACLRA